jgi:sugar lactone lactonase YvrE
MIAAGGLILLAGSVLLADPTRFSDFTPLTSSAGPTADEAFPITFGNADIRQQSIADRNSQLAAGKPNAGAWDMIVVNETGAHKARFLFSPFESGAGGIQRHNLETGETDTIWQSWSGSPATRMDPSYWTPWGTYITGEENWGDCSGPNYRCGRLFELRNPTTAPAIFNPVGANSNDGADVRHANVIPRASQEGIQFDKDDNMYFIDELSTGCIYRYTSKAKSNKVKNGHADYFAAGQTSVLRVGNGTVAGATGAFTWVPITDTSGNVLPGGVTITDANGVVSVDGRATCDVAAYKGTDYNRPEDMQIQTVKGRQNLYFNETSTHKTYVMDLSNQVIKIFADRTTIDLATGLPVGSAFSSPDNLAIDHEGNIYIVEDENGGVNDDVWFARDLNKDGDLLDAGEGIGRWASNGTLGSEFTGMYFDPSNKRRGWINIQHPGSGNDRTIEFTLPGGPDDGD